MKEPTNAVLNAFFDSKAQSYSIPRFIMFVGFVAYIATLYVIIDIVHNAYYSNRDIPDLSWVAALFGISVTGTTAPYIMSRISAKNDPSMIAKEMEFALECEDDDIPAHPTPNQEEEQGVK